HGHDKNGRRELPEAELLQKIAITGIGIAAPSGIGKRQFWANIKSGRSFVKEITRFDASRYPSHIAGQIDELEKYSHISERLLKKIDVFSHMALIASEMALLDAGIDIKKEDPNLIGIFLGNAIGGWLYAETELRDLYIEGRQGVSPYMASAWFPAAPQGQVSIYYGIKGFSKTVVSDRASSLMAIGYAAKVLSKAKLNMILAGGMEAPVTPYALLCCNTYGGLSSNNNHPQEAYRPFDKNRSGFVIAEGAGIIVMEGCERARSRNANIMALISGYSSTCDGVDRINPAKDGKQLAAAIKMALANAKISSNEIDYISLDGLAMDIWDDSELLAIKEVFKDKAGDIPLSCPKSMFGNLLGASGAVDLITTILAMEHSLVPPTLNLEEPAIPGLNYIGKETREHKINKALIISRGRGGINSVLVIEKF
ncbi:MAG: beta-ketoacyl-[acyl-carrier-protein] synthase family protein, partial [Candidatus Omnitrophota bacterium]|nr:beta-ketoacyl-[acyl-carrier-protein] synthase family protein [Candidatus Omnitrophota bacterium]